MPYQFSHLLLPDGFLLPTIRCVCCFLNLQFSFYYCFDTIPHFWSCFLCSYSINFTRYNRKDCWFWKLPHFPLLLQWYAYYLLQFLQNWGSVSKRSTKFELVPSSRMKSRYIWTLCRRWILWVKRFVQNEKQVRLTRYLVFSKMLWLELILRWLVRNTEIETRISPFMLQSNHECDHTFDF